MGTDAQRISTEPDRFATVHISQGFRVGDLIFISGQAAVNEQGEVVGVGDFGAQARQAIRNLDRVLNAAGSSLDQVIKVTIFVTDITRREEVWKARTEFFTGDFPCSTLVEVSALARPGLAVEIEAHGFIGASK